MSPESSTDNQGDSSPSTEEDDRVLEVVDGIIAFSVPEAPSVEEGKLAADIAILDHHAKYQLKPGTREWTEVHGFLYNAVVHLQRRDSDQGRAIFAEAERVYYRHNQANNRFRYLVGAISGIFASAALGMALYSLLASGVNSVDMVIEPRRLILLLVFAGMGCVTSILTRISSIDLKEETSTFLVFVSGFSRPVVAIFFAIAVYLILELRVVDIRIGDPAKTSQFYLIASFLCGFSERFATDIIARVSLKETEPSTSTATGQR